MAIRATATIALLALAPAAAFAQDDATATRSPVVSTQSSPALVFTLRGGVATQPEYFGSDEYDVGPDLGFSLNSLSFGGRSFGNPDPWAEARGFGIRGSFRYIGERDDDDYGELEGLDDIDAAIAHIRRYGSDQEQYAQESAVLHFGGGNDSILGRAPLVGHQLRYQEQAANRPGGAQEIEQSCRQSALRAQRNRRQ